MQDLFSIIELSERFDLPDCATFEELIQDGQYDSCQTDLITRNFSVTRYGSRRLFLAELQRDMPTTEALVEAISYEDKTLSTIEDFLLYGAHPFYRDAQRKSSVSCLGSFFSLAGVKFGFNLAGCSNFTQRILRPIRWHSSWRKRDAFLFTGKAENE